MLVCFMLQFSILASVADFAREFERCCQEYEQLHLATAWCGDPKHVLPYAHLEGFAGGITATVGRHFDHTHPDAIEFLLKRRASLRVFRKEKGLFHAKLYLFSSGDKRAIFLGSSNLTHSGFYINFEANILLEGVPNATEMTQVEGLETQLILWRSDEFSFVPDEAWIAAYRKDFTRALRAEKKAGIISPREYESEISRASWLARATWNTYYKKILEGLKQDPHRRAQYLAVLDHSRQKLQLPWKAAYFDELELRKLIAGMDPYGSLGNVSASGDFRRMLANGTAKEHQAIVRIINTVGTLSPPIRWDHLRALLQELVELGPSMKVWGRILCLIRPDLYCTISSIPVRTNLSKTLKIPQSRFEHPGRLCTAYEAPTRLAVVQISQAKRGKRTGCVAQPGGFHGRNLLFLTAFLKLPRSIRAVVFSQNVRNDPLA